VHLNSQLVVVRSAGCYNSALNEASSFGNLEMILKSILLNCSIIATIYNIKIWEFGCP